MKQLRVLHISKSKLCKILLDFKAIQAIVRGTDFTFCHSLVPLVVTIPDISDDASLAAILCDSH